MGPPTPQTIPTSSRDPAYSSKGPPTAPPGPGRGAHHDCGRPGAGPPGPLLVFSEPPAGAGGPQLLPLRPWLGPSGSAPLPAASDAHCAQRPQVRSTPVPAALSQPRAHGGTFIPARRRRPLAAPKRRASTRDVSAHGPGCSTRSLFFFVIFGRKREKLGRWRAAGLPMEARRGWNGNLGI